MNESVKMHAHLFQTWRIRRDSDYGVDLVRTASLMKRKIFHVERVIPVRTLSSLITCFMGKEIMSVREGRTCLSWYTQCLDMKLPDAHTHNIHTASSRVRD